VKRKADDNLGFLERARILIVDDDEELRSLLARLLKINGYATEEAASAEEAAAAIGRFPPDLILLDVDLPGRSGQALLEEIRAVPELKLTPIVMLTGAATPARKLKAIQAGATEFLPKPFSHVELTARVRSLLELKFLTDELEHAERMIVALAEAIDARDPYTYGHSARVSLFAGMLGERLGIEDRALRVLKSGGLFHDIGKIAVRDRVLLKPGKLTDDERAEIRLHPVKGRDLLRNMKSMDPALAIVLHHHERMDGSGYPEGLSGTAIPIAARITTIADVFDALTSARVYRSALSRAAAMRILEEESRKGWWDGELVDEFRGVLETVPEDDPRIARAEIPPGDRSFE
jgi:putative two-component system response regulator